MLPTECPSCGAPLAFERRDASFAAACGHCKRVLEVPQKKGSTVEKIVEEEGRKTIERRTEWVSYSALEKGAEPAFPPGTWEVAAGAGGAGTRYSMGGKTFDDLDAFEAHLRATLPPEMADAMLKMLRPPPGTK